MQGRLHGDRGTAHGEAVSPKLTPLIDREQLAHKLEMRLGEVVTHSQQRGFPAPVAYFRGRMLWDEAAIDRWLARRAQASRPSH